MGVDPAVAAAAAAPDGPASAGSPADRQRHPVADTHGCTGAPWRDLPERYGSWKTVYSRFRRWSEQGIWDQVFNALITEAQRRGDLDWELHHIDSTIVRAHQHAAGARKRGIKTPPAASS
jgi:transposase